MHFTIAEITLTFDKDQQAFHAVTGETVNIVSGAVIPGDEPGGERLMCLWIGAGGKINMRPLFVRDLRPLAPPVVRHADASGPDALASRG